MADPNARVFIPLPQRCAYCRVFLRIHPFRDAGPYQPCTYGRIHSFFLAWDRPVCVEVARG